MSDQPINKNDGSSNTSEPGVVETSEVTRVSEETTAGGDRKESVVEADTVKTMGAAPPRPNNRNTILFVSLVAVVALVIVFGLLWRGRSGGAGTDVKVNAEAGGHGAEEGGEHGGAGKEVELSPEALAAAGIEIEGVTQRPAVSLLRATGTVEVNQQQTQQASPLVGGRVERVNVALGDAVRAGQTLAVIASPQLAQMHGKLHEAETTLALAERNLQRVQRAENRVAVLTAKAQLDEAEATLKRTRRLIELGAGAGKDLVAAEAAYRTAKARYDFENNISLNRELQEARAAVETARVDVNHIRDEMRALGAPVARGEREDDHSHDTSLVAVRAPVSGTVTERLVNAGAGVEPGTSMFTIANLATVWIIANVPEAQLGQVRPGTPARITSAVLGQSAVAGRVNYIDPQLNEETRTGRVRVEVANPNGQLKAGMFVEVGFEAGTGAATGEEMVVRSEAVQRIGDRTVVFIPKTDEPGHFEVRDVEIGGESDGYHRVLGGLRLGDRVVTKGSFTLKTQSQKGEMGEHGH
ncbi:MAG: efflux RND transporter periplasmic adaptor subunit [Pyrinomonadaceae bacterium]